MNRAAFFTALLEFEQNHPATIAKLSLGAGIEDVRDTLHLFFLKGANHEANLANEKTETIDQMVSDIIKKFMEEKK